MAPYLKIFLFTLNLNASLSYGLGVQSTRALARATNGPLYISAATTFGAAGRAENDRGMLHPYDDDDDDGVQLGRAEILIIVLTQNGRLI